MAKNKTVFVCSNCGYESPKWMGKCPACNEWNSFYEEKLVTSTNSHSNKKKEINKPVSLSQIEGKVEFKIGTGFSELDRVLGGGLVKGSAVLIGGDPGIGKSTLLLQTMCALSNKKLKCLYISGEESTNQIRIRW